MESGFKFNRSQYLIYLRLIRWPNVLMTVLVQVVVVYFYLPQTYASPALDTSQVLLLFIINSLLAATGNIINDIYDVQTDRLNKPDRVIVGTFISEKIAYRWYIGLTVFMILCVFVLSNQVGQAKITGLYISASFLLFLYATQLKRVLIVGNVVISFLVAFVVLIIAIFELMSSITDDNRHIHLTLLIHLSVFALLAFLVNLLRENIKDCEDMKGDHATGRNSLPIAIGRSRACKLLSIYTLLLVISLGYLSTIHLNGDATSLYYTLFLIIAPLMFIGLRLWNADSLKEFKILSLVCKFVLLFGILGIAIIKIEL